MQSRHSDLPETDDLFRARLDQIINMRHELVALADKIDWATLEEKQSPLFSTTGRPSIPSRLITGLHLLKAIHNLSDEVVCARWVENPYFQYFCGETFFQHEFPIELSSMTHWRQRVGEEFCQALIQESLRVAFQCKALKTKHLQRVVVDTTVQPKAVTFPTDVKLRYKALTALTQLAKVHGVSLRQSYARVAKKAVMMSERYRHARQMKRARKQEKFVQTRLGRVMRGIVRKTSDDPQLQTLFSEPLRKAYIAFKQQKNSAIKLYSWHAPEVECIGKGKTDKPYEFGCKVSITTHINRAPAGYFVLHAQALHGRPYDGHTLREVLENQIKQLGIEPE